MKVICWQVSTELKLLWKKFYQYWSCYFYWKKRIFLSGILLSCQMWIIHTFCLYLYNRYFMCFSVTEVRGGTWQQFSICHYVRIMYFTCAWLEREANIGILTIETETDYFLILPLAISGSSLKSFSNLAVSCLILLC